MKQYLETENSNIEWIGDIPNHWKISKLLHVLSKKEKRNNDEIERKMLSVSQYLGIIEKKYESDELKKSKEDTFRYLVVEPTDLVVNVMWLQFRGLGVSYLGGIVSPDYKVYEVDSSLIHSDFLNYLVRSNYYLSEYPKHLRGIRPNSSRISNYAFLRLPLLLPPLEEQTEITNFLNIKNKHIEETINQHKLLISFLKEKKQVVINQIIQGFGVNITTNTEAEWFRNIPKDWNVKRLKYISKVELSSVDRHKNDDEELVRVCHYPHVYNNEKITPKTKLDLGTCTTQQLVKFKIKQDDILITKDSETQDDIGVPAYVTDNLEKTVCGYHIAQITTNKNHLLGKFLFTFLKIDRVRDYFMVNSNGVTRYGLEKYPIENLPISYPSLVKQKEIADSFDEKIDAINMIIQNIEIKMKKLMKYRHLLISETIIGKIDVREEKI